MANASKKLEEKLIEFGNILASSPPSSVDDLYSLLHRIDTHLSRVEQSPSPSTLTALQPLMKKLVVEELLRHSDMDVKAAVASCISEITRITAPDAPYDDDIMKEIFQMIVGAFETLDDMSGRSFQKRVSVLETVAKVRSCVVMLDLECDALILEMFHHFLKTIRVDHTENVFTSMETIMTLVIEESEDISPELLSCLLNAVKEDNKDVLPIACNLVEKVMTKCADKIKPYLLELVQSTGASLGDYSKVVASICQEDSNASDHIDPNGSGEVLADESKLSERTVSDEQPQMSAKLEEVGCPENVDAPEDTSLMATSNGAVQLGNGDSMEQPSSPKQKSERSRRSGQSKNPTAEHVDANNLESPALKRPKDLKANSSVQLTDTTDHCRVDSDEDTPAVTSRRRGRKKKVGNSQVNEASAKDAEEAVSLGLVEKNEHQHLPGSDNRISVALLTPAERPMDSGRKKKGRPSGSKASARHRHVNSVSDRAASLSEEKDETHENTQTDVTREDISKKEPEDADDGEAPACIMSDSEVKPQRNSIKRGGLKRKVIEQESLGRKQRSSKEEQKKDTTLRKEVSGDPSLKDMSPSSPRSTSKKPERDQTHLEGGDKPKTRRKRAREIEDISETPDRKMELNENLVGSKIKVWWPDDEEFYNGVIDSFDPKEKKHKIIYADGDVEILDLKDEQWKYAENVTKEGGTLKDEGNASQAPRVKKAKASSNSLSKKENSHAQSSGIESSSKEGKRPRGRPRAGASSLGKLSYDNTPKLSSKAKGKPASEAGANTPKSINKSKDGSESQSDDITLKMCNKKDEPGHTEEVDTLNIKVDTSKTSGKSKDEPSKKRGRKPKKGTPNASSKVEDGTSKGSSRDEADTSKLKESTTPGTESCTLEGGDVVGKNQTLKTKLKSRNSTPKCNDSKANGVSSKGKVKAKESIVNNAGVDDGEATTGGTGGRKRKRKGGRK